MKNQKLAALTLVFGILGSSLVGCQNTSSSSSGGAAGAASAGSAPRASSDAQNVKTVQVATSGTPKPFNYVGSDNKPTGFEIELLQKIDDELKDYTFQYNVTEFDSLFAGLDSKKYDLVVNNLSRSKEREAKYVISKQSYFQAPTVLIVNPDNTAVKSIDDIGGLKIPAGAGRSNAIFLEDYNKKHPTNPAKITYTDAGSDQLLVDLHNKRYDAAIYSETYVDFVEQSYGYKYKVVSLTDEQEKQIVSNPGAWIFYNQDDTKLRDETDTVLKKFIGDGTLSALSKKWFNGKDYIKDLPTSDK